MAAGVVLLTLCVTPACSSGSQETNTNGTPAHPEARTSAKGSPQIPDFGGTAPGNADNPPQPGFRLTLDRTTTQGYTYSLAGSGDIGSAEVDPESAPIGETFVTETLDAASFTISNTTDRAMDVGQDDLQIGGLGVLAAFPRGAKICRVFASQWALPDGRCGGGLAEFRLQDTSALTIASGDTQPLKAISPPTGKDHVLAFQVPDKPSATSAMRTALKHAAICLVVVKPGTGDADHTPGVTLAAACGPAR